MNRFQHISIADTRELVATGGIVLVDVRDAMSYNNGHIEGAVLLDNSNVAEFIAATDRATPVVVYCYHGHSSQGAAQYLVEQGFATVYSLDGGFEAWRISS